MNFLTILRRDSHTTERPTDVQDSSKNNISAASLLEVSTVVNLLLWMQKNIPKENIV
jgi:hypothetical protein